MGNFSKSLGEYAKSMIPWFIFIAFDVIGWQVDIPFLPFLSNISDDVFVLISFLLLLTGSAFAYHRVREERDNCRAALSRKGEIEEILDSLSDLREEGVGLRNSGSQISSSQKKDWMTRADDWRGKVIAELVKLSSTEVGLFDTLDLFSAPMYESVQDQEIRHQMRMLSAETMRIMAASLRWQGYIA